ncbi:MAG: hypothetical protein GY792_34175 [Gammaproteobacteria bacterium]|nr:hypothetical protein [Gammaproteobacteria bacterium]
MRSTGEADGMPRIEFIAEAEQCPLCDGALKVYKTRSRQVITLEAGPFRAIEMLKRCNEDHAHPIIGSNALARLVKPRQRYGYDLIVQVGCARYLELKQREEIQAELYRQQGIELSSGSLSRLCDRFLTYLEALHLARVPQLRAALTAGYPLHIDATCEKGKGGLFVCMDGWRGWVLTAGRIPSEHEDHLRPLVEKTTSLFGDPIAVVRDMGSGGAKAVAPLREKGVPDLICHFHFLAAVGKKLFDQPNRLLRNLLKSSKVHADLRVMLRDLRRYTGSSPREGRFGMGVVREDLPALILWLLEGDGSKDLPYPFSLTHLEFQQRYQQALQRAQGWVPTPRTLPERRAIEHLASLVGRFDKDSRFTTAITRLERGWQAFCELRDVLQLSNAELPRADVRAQQRELAPLEARRMREIETALSDYRTELAERIACLQHDGSLSASPYPVIVKYLDRYEDRLFGHPFRYDDDGTMSAIVERTNNVLEHFFGDEKQRLRRRLGRAHLGRDLQDQPAQAALAANLRHPDYVRVLCGSIAHLPIAFAELDDQDLEQAGPLSRTSRDTSLLQRIRAWLKGEKDNENEPAS